MIVTGLECRIIYLTEQDKGYFPFPRGGLLGTAVQEFKVFKSPWVQPQQV